MMCMYRREIFFASPLICRLTSVQLIAFQHVHGYNVSLILTRGPNDARTIYTVVNGGSMDMNVNVSACRALLESLGFTITSDVTNHSSSITEAEVDMTTKAKSIEDVETTGRRLLV